MRPADADTLGHWLDGLRCSTIIKFLIRMAQIFVLLRSPKSCVVTFRMSNAPEYIHNTSQMLDTAHIISPLFDSLDPSVIHQLAGQRQTLHQ